MLCNTRTIGIETKTIGHKLQQPFDSIRVIHGIVSSVGPDIRVLFQYSTSSSSSSPPPLSVQVSSIVVSIFKVALTLVVKHHFLNLPCITRTNESFCIFAKHHTPTVRPQHQIVQVAGYQGTPYRQVWLYQPSVYRLSSTVYSHGRTMEP